MRSQVLHAPGSVLSRDERPLMVKRTSGFRDLSFFEKWFLFCFVSCLLLLFLFHGFIGALRWHTMLVFIVTHSHMHSTTVYLTNVITHYFPFCSLPPFLGPFPVLYSAALDVQEMPPKTFLPIFLSDFHVGGFFFFFARVIFLKCHLVFGIQPISLNFLFIFGWISNKTKQLHLAWCLKVLLLRGTSKNIRRVAWDCTLLHLSIQI